MSSNQNKSAPVVLETSSGQRNKGPTDVDSYLPRMRQAYIDLLREGEKAAKPDWDLLYRLADAQITLLNSALQRCGLQLTETTQPATAPKPPEKSPERREHAVRQPPRKK